MCLCRFISLKELSSVPQVKIFETEASSFPVLVAALSMRGQGTDSVPVVIDRLRRDIQTCGVLRNGTTSRCENV